MNIRDLQERRALIVTEMRGLTEKPTGTGGDLSAEQAQKFDTLKAELDGIEKRIGRQQVLDETERRMQGQQIAGSGDDRLDEELRNFSLRKAICMQVPDLAQQTDCGRERELSNEIAKRAGRAFRGVAVPMSVFLEKRTLVGGGGSPDSGGINLIATDLRGDQFIDTLRAKLVIRQLGARVLSGLVGNVDIPKQASSATANWVADNTPLSASDPTYQKIQLDMKTCGALTEYSRAMLLQSSPDIEQLLRMDHAKVLAAALDVAALNGAGGNEPTGILNTTGLSTVSGSTPTWGQILSMIETVEEGNTEGSGWVTTPGMKRLLRSTVRVASTDSVMIMESRNTLADYPVAVTQNAPRSLGSPAESDALIFGDWTDLLIGFWSELDVLVNPFSESAFNRGNVLIRAMMSVDIAPRHIDSFCAMTNVSPG